ncbi:MAG: DUF2313 domain-containing protein [Reyranella sp.]|uniref:putative phage tail protein n=1 Tax=Reyranella sp. TaxID=1929291 RepID=UPI0025D257F5|nr:putative phage tail protein [Reyranella sp.]MBR2813485.1 DUF2313 domain-containing protein [Reyranella sp.]
MSSAPRPSIADWLQATMDLLPLGIAWPREPTSNVGKVLQVIADERAQRHDRKLVLLEVESFPPSAVDLLPEWERVAGLPDPCRPAPGTLAERRSELIDQLFGDHTPTPALMIALAARAGWNITIREQRDFIAGISMAGDPVGESDHTWIVTVLDQSISFFRAGGNAGGDPLWTWPDLSTLECVLRRAAPAHTNLIFYVPPEEP